MKNVLYSMNKTNMLLLRTKNDSGFIFSTSSTIKYGKSWSDDFDIIQNISILSKKVILDLIESNKDNLSQEELSILTELSESDNLNKRMIKIKDKSIILDKSFTFQMDDLKNIRKIGEYLYVLNIDGNLHEVFLNKKDAKTLQKIIIMR